MTDLSPRRFRPDIEGMRAVAVLLVVLYHAGVPGITGGFVGVDVFFVISGFLITTHLLGEIRATGRLSLRRFYARRIRRLLPAAALVTAFTVVASWIWLSSVAARTATTDALWTTFLGLNVRYAQQAVDYQANADPSPLQHYWSLAVEEQFYLVWPLLVIALTLWWARRTDRTGPPRLLVAALVALVAGSLAWCVVETQRVQPDAYFLMPSRAWELGAGALVAVAASRLARLPRPVTATLSVAGLGSVVASALLYTDATLFPGTAAIVPVLGTALVLLGGVGRASAAETVLRLRPLQGLGRVSYGWYLWHWPLLVLLPGFLQDTPSLGQRLTACVVALWLAVASSVAIEHPLRFLPALRAPSRSFAMGLGLVTAVLLTATITPLVAPSTVGTGTVRVALSLPRTGAAGVLQDAIDTGLAVEAVPANLTPTVEELPDDQPRAVWADGRSCMQGLSETTVGGTCRVALGGPAATADRPTVLLTGDSHAYQWFPALAPIARQRGWDLSVIAKSGCPLYDTTIYSWDFKRDYTECDRWRADAVERISRLDPDLVVTSGFVASSRGTGYARSWNDGVTETLDRLTSRGAPVVAIQDTPWPRTSVPECIEAHLDDVGACTVPRVQPWRDADRQDGTLAASSAVAGVTVVDPTDWLCSTACPVIVGNTPVYKDDTHLSATYAAKLSPLLQRRLPEPRASA